MIRPPQTGSAGERGRLPLWREEFSIHRAEEQYVNRRQFGKFLVLTSLGMLAGNVWIAIRAALRRPESFPRREITAASSLAVGTSRVFFYPTADDPCLLVRRALWDQLGGLHEGYRNGMEDIDLCVRLRREGFSIYVSHESVIGHLVSSSPGRHDANDANTTLFRERCATTAARWGREEWAHEYFRRYARRWWRMDPVKAWLALRLVLGFPLPRRFRAK